MEELIALVASYPRDNPELALDAAAVAAFRGHYAKLLYEVQNPCSDVCRRIRTFYACLFCMSARCSACLLESLMSMHVSYI